jgi:hypothetical protein
MAKKSIASSNWLQTATVRVTRVHFLFIVLYILSLVVFDSWNLYSHQAMGQLWTAAGLMLVVNTVFWYLARMKFSKSSIYAFIVLALVAADIVFASYIVLWQRGLASKSVILFAVPIITSAALRSRSTVLATASLCAAAYSTVAVRYFFEHYGESYRVELYGTVGFFCALFFVLAALLLTIILPKNERF